MTEETNNEELAEEKIINSLLDESDEALEIFETVPALEEKISQYPDIDNDEKLSAATEFVAQAKTLRKELEDERKSLISDAQARVKSINEQTKKIRDRIDAVISHFETVVKRYMTKQAEVQAKELAEKRAKMREENADQIASLTTDLRSIKADMGRTPGTETAKILELSNKLQAVVRRMKKLGVDDPEGLAGPKVTVRGALGSTGTLADAWTFKVIDLSQVPREYLCIDTQAVNRAIKDGIREINGLEIYNERVLKTRTAQ